ncbi:alpha-hydroxy-acid oxidizing protein, partial [Bartonella sp. CL63NXGY]|uniref:alpha-hydroxy-acid oxidizing protein n=1 Tax=Bartonella sp. CL63NXGY TaxID=3243538 RepID=UPI0035D089DD
VIVKEVGFGMDQEAIKQLHQMGVQYVNISGRGGTNFARIEDRRNHQTSFADLHNWGQTTPESLLEARQAHLEDLTVVSSGGICTPLDVIKSGVLGASAVGVAGYFLQILQTDGMERLDQIINQWCQELPRLLTLLGCQSFAELQSQPFVLHGQTYEYAQQRHLL